MPISEMVLPVTESVSVWLLFGGDNAGWGTWATGYSTKLHVWSSKDLIHFQWFLFAPMVSTVPVTVYSPGLEVSTLETSHITSRLAVP